MGRVTKSLLDMIFPIECVRCRDEGIWLCDYCFSKIEFMKESICPLCNRSLKLGYSCVCTITSYVDVYITFLDLEKNIFVSDLIHKLKYNFAQGIAHDLARVSLEFFQKVKLPPFYEGGFKIDKVFPGREENVSQAFVIGKTKYCPWDKNNSEIILIPVPLHKKRFLWRGFNQAELILSNIIEKSLPCNKNDIARHMENLRNILVRNKNTKFQAKTKMPEEKRRLNMKDAFQCKDVSSVKGKTVILFDDVITTGSTMEECAKTLKDSGAKKIIAIAIGKG